jgi:hypothetical protein
MSLPQFKDWNKVVEDVFKDDFDLKYVLKAKNAAPNGLNVTTSTEFKNKGGKTSLNGKISTKWAQNGFSLDKFEIKDDGSIVTESSLTGVYPGVKLEFKGDDSLKADLGVIYSCSAATVTAEADVVEFSGVKASVWATSSGASFGGALDYKLNGGDLKTLDVAASYPVNGTFIGLKTSNKFSKFDASVSFPASKQYTLAGLFGVTPDKSEISAAVAVVAKQNDNTTIKVKVNSDGILNASVKQSFSKTCSVVGATELNLRDPSAFKLGLTTTLG